MKHAAILAGTLSNQLSVDEDDTTWQITLVKRSLKTLGYRVHIVHLNIDITEAFQQLVAIKPEFVFNLVESVRGRDEFLLLGPILLEALGIPFVGNNLNAIFQTTDKVIAKEWLRANHLPTADWIESEMQISENFTGPFIVKPRCEDGSVGIFSDSCVQTYEQLREVLKKRNKSGGDWFAEKYIDGREIHVSLIETISGPKTLPPSELLFLDFAPDKPQILDYQAKWGYGSFSYKHVVSTFHFEKEDEDLKNCLSDLSLKCWNIFQLGGWARVDFRIDQFGQPWILEINANPSLNSIASFCNACFEAGMNSVEMIHTIITAPSVMSKK